MTLSRRTFCKQISTSLLAPSAGYGCGLLSGQSHSRYASNLPAGTNTEQANQSGTTRIVATRDGYQILRDGQPYFIRGAGGSRRLDVLVSSGGNSLRTWGPSPETLDEAQRYGLTVLMGLRIGRPRQGFNYADQASVEHQLDQIRQDVTRMKDHPALLMWALGNEVELNVAPADRPRLWRALEQVAQLVHRLDPRHPVIVVLGGLDGTKLNELKQDCPSIDAVGINAYASMMNVPETIEREQWTKPYLITEFGPRGHWEVAKTSWGARLEDNSTQKAEFYLQAYRHTIANRPRCLGSYAFYWDQKQEKTQTWYGMFLPNGNRTAAVDAMAFAWTGRWPDDRCPRIGPQAMTLRAAKGSTMFATNCFATGSLIECAIDATDPEGQALTISWDLRVDVANAPQHGGDQEPASEAINGSVVSISGKTATLLLPKTPGEYRVFVYVSDPAGSSATANLPILVRNASV